jgi:hypothetical protein
MAKDPGTHKRNDTRVDGSPAPKSIYLGGVHLPWQTARRAGEEPRRSAPGTGTPVSNAGVSPPEALFSFGGVGVEFLPESWGVSLTPVLLVSGALLLAVLLLGVGLVRRRRSRRPPANGRVGVKSRSSWVSQPVVLMPDGGKEAEPGMAKVPAGAAGVGRRAGGAAPPSHALLGLDPSWAPPGGPPPRRRGRGVLVAVAVAGALAAGALFGGPWWAAPDEDELMWSQRPAVAAARTPAASGLGDAEAAPVAVVDPERGTQLIAWSGNEQTGSAGRPLPRALAVVVRDSTDRPVPGAEVRFSVAAGGGRVEPGRVQTSDLGLATTTWWLGDDPSALRAAAELAGEAGLRVEFRAALAEVPVRPDEPPEPAVAVASEAEGTATGSDPLDVTAVDGRPAAAAEATPPRAAPLAIRTRAAFSAGGTQTCRVVAGQGAVCWGGETGSARPSAPPLRSVSVGVFHACGATQRGAAYCWPAPGAGGANLAAPGRELELPDGGRAVDVAAGAEHSCALVADGRVFCWGANAHGQLGNGTTSDSAAPVQVVGLPPAVQLVVGWLHACALTADGRAYCWGANGRGQVGDGGSADRAQATAVDHGQPFTLLTAGSAHSCGLTAAGAAWCWGSNEHGQLGTGGASGQSRPGRVAGEQSFRTLAAGGVHTCGLTADGAAWCWGRNTFGQLGNGTATDAGRPSRVAGGHALVALAAGGAHTCAETDGGQVYCWGNNVQGQVGDGTRENRNVPVPLRQEERS